MTDPTTTPTPPQGLTDAQLDALERQHWEPTGVVSEAMQKEEIFNYRAFARAAISSHEANHLRTATKMPLTPEEVDARFRAWWAESYPLAPAGGHAVRSHVAFALYLLGGEVGQ